MLIHDYPVPKRTLEQLESIALDLRKRLGILGMRVDVFELLFGAMPAYLKDRKLTMISRPAGYMGERDAYAVSKPNRIFYRPRLLAELRVGGRKAGLEFLHELSHILIHPGAEKAWVTTGNETKTFIPQEESAEWQATVLALAIMAPRHLAEECQDAQDLAEKFGIDAGHASMRYSQIELRRRRKIPDVYFNVRRQLAGATETPNFVEERCSNCGECKLIKKLIISIAALAAAYLATTFRTETLSASNSFNRRPSAMEWKIKWRKIKSCTLQSAMMDGTMSFGRMRTGQAL